MREADADRARVHPAAVAGDGGGGRVTPREAAVEGSVREGLHLAGRRDREALRRRRRRRQGAPGRGPAGVRGPDGRRIHIGRCGIPRGGTAPDARAAAPRVRICPDDRVAPLPRGARLHVLHRLRREPRLHAGDHERALRSPAPTRDRQLEWARVHRRRARRRARLPRQARRVRRRPGEAGADLEPDRPPADPRRRKLERRHPDAALGGRQRTAGATPPRPARRRRARVRLREGRRAGARAGAGGGLDGRQREERLGCGLRRA